MRIPNRDLPDRITIRRILAVGSSVGAKFDADQARIRARVIDKRGQVVDMRPSSETRGQTVTTSARVFMHPENYIAPDGQIVIFPGTPMERTVTVVAASYRRDRRAPESAQAWCV